MANSWDEFFAAPVKASKKLHVTASDVKRGAQIDARRREAERLVAEQNKTTPTGLPYGITPRPSGVPSDAPSLYAGELTKSASPELIGNALLAGNLGGLSAAFGALAPLRAGLAVGAGADAILGAKAGEGDIPAVLSGAGMMGRRALPMALATGAAYAADAEASPVQKMLQMFYHGSNKPLERGVIRGALDVSPQRRVGQYFADKRTNDLGGVPRVHSILADPFAGEKHGLALPFDRLDDSTPNFTQARRLSEKDRPIQLVPDNGVEEFAGGGLVKSGLKMMFPNLAAPMHVVKPKGGNWLNNSVEDALRGLRREGMNDVNPEVDSLNRFVEGPLTKYVKTRMASPEDEVRRLAEQGVLHFDPGIGSPIVASGARQNARLSGNFEAKAVSADNTLARGWENSSDAAVLTGTYADHAPFDGMARPTYWKTQGEFAMKNPGVMAHDWNRGSTPTNLGFDHLVDELSNALNPNSGLPRHLQLTPEAVKNLSMEKAVRRVADINAWRAAQKIEASQKIAGGPGQELVREYAHSPEKPNPKGLRWVELKKSEEWHPEGWKGEPLDELRQQYLADQLKYEGDTMGHCVGGYCDDVVAGRSRIFSLRGANGEPHVTVEVGKAKHPDDADLYFDLPEAKQEEFMDLGHGEAVRRGIEEGSDEYMQAVNEHASALGRQWIAEQHARLKDTPVILQIKGKQNRKPKDEYLPFVQDFVKNPPHGAPWGDVGDLGNTGLFRVQPGQKWPGFAEDMPAGYWSLEDAEKQAVEKGMDPDVLQNWLQKLRNSHPGYASGGSVSATLGGWEALTDPTGSPAENKLSWDIFSGHNDPEQLEAVQ